MLLEKFRPSRLYCLDRDSRRAGSTIFIAGVGRSGTTWLSEVINYSNHYRDIFEPFHPHRNLDARYFRYHHYMGKNSANEVQRMSAIRILQGRTQGVWSGKHNHRCYAGQRIIKDIRTNLMLHWLLELRPDMPLVLIMRNPLDVYKSWQKLGWGRQDRAERSDFQALLDQQELFSDYPELSTIREGIEPGDRFGEFIFLWCVLYYVPLHKLAPGDFILCRFEQLVHEPLVEFRKIYDYLEMDFDEERFMDVVTKPSATSVPFDAGVSIGNGQREQMERVLGQFGLDKFYWA